MTRERFERLVEEALKDIPRRFRKEMRNVAVSVGASAWALASADERMALSIAAIVQRAGLARVTLELQQGSRLAEAEPDVRLSRLRQAEIVATWRKWYAEAVRSARRVVSGPPTASFVGRLDQLARAFDR